MRVLFINPPYVGWLLDIKAEPIGLLYLAALARENGHEVELYDPYIGEDQSRFEELMERFKPDIVGCSVYTVTEEFCFDIARLTKELRGDAVFVAGGPHPTFTARRMLERCPAIDVVAHKESEETFLELMACVAERGDLGRVAGITYRADDGGVYETPPRQVRLPIDDIPYPAKDLLDDRYYDKYYATGVVSARGCPYKCDFCVSPVFFKGVRNREIELVADELQALMRTREIRHVRFYDDVFVFNLKKVKKIVEHIGPLNVTWDSYIRVDCTTDEMLELMKEAGCSQVRFGVESGLDVYRTACKGGRTVSFEEHERVVKRCRELEIETMASYILGFPDETREQMEITIDFADRLGTDLVGFYKLTPYPGTIYWEMLDLERISLEGFTKLDNQASVNRYMGPDELAEVVRHAYKTYFRHRPHPEHDPDALRFIQS
jgi:radical SAM superfamily enzyme YgiQ (UPF0313 family)